MLSFILLLWFALCVIEPFLIMHQTQHFHLLLFADTFCGSVFPRLSLLFFSPTTSWCFNMTLQVFAVMLCWMVLTLACPETVPFALPCCLSCICFGARCAWSNRLCVEFRVVSCFPLPTSFADLYSFCNDWYWTPISALRKHLKKTSQKHKTNFSNISKTLTKLLTHAKDTKQTSQTSRTQNKHLKHHKLCNKGVSYMYFMIKLSF